jgi:hypothetical protein
VTKTAVGIEFGVVTTDIHGNGRFTVVVGPIAASTYDLEFDARNGAGCNLTGGGGNTTSTCEADVQSPAQHSERRLWSSCLDARTCLLVTLELGLRLLFGIIWTNGRNLIRDRFA